MPSSLFWSMDEWSWTNQVIKEFNHVEVFRDHPISLWQIVPHPFPKVCPLLGNLFQGINGSNRNKAISHGYSHPIERSISLASLAKDSKGESHQDKCSSSPLVILVHTYIWRRKDITYGKVHLLLQKLMFLQTHNIHIMVEPLYPSSHNRSMIRIT